MSAKVESELAPAAAESALPNIKSNGLRGLFTMAKPLDYAASVASSIILTGLGVALVAFIFVLEPFFGGAADAESSGGGLPMSVVNQMTISFIIIGAGQFRFACVTRSRSRDLWPVASILAVRCCCC